jgi:hypothetical protein
MARDDDLKREQAVRSGTCRLRLQLPVAEEADGSARRRPAISLFW